MQLDSRSALRQVPRSHPFTVLLILTVSSFAQTATFRSDVNLVTISFTVRDDQNRLIGDLDRNEVEVFENGVPQKVRFFARSTDLPLRVGLIVDASYSQLAFLQRHHGDIERFLRDVLGAKDQVFLVGFANHVRLVSDFTASVADIMHNLRKYEQQRTEFPRLEFAQVTRLTKDEEREQVRFPDLGPLEVRVEGTAFYDALYYSMNKLSRVSNGRRVLVVFSDGEDNSSAHTLLDVIETAEFDDVLIYCIRYTDQKHAKARNRYGQSVMHRIAGDSGAFDFDALTGSLQGTFLRLGSELRALYEVGYYSSNVAADSTFRNVQLRSTHRRVTIRAKAGYVRTIETK